MNDSDSAAFRAVLLSPADHGGGWAGTWFPIGYLLYPIVGIGGFTSISSFLFAIETYERRELNYGIMLVGLTLLFVGVLAGCVLLGIAGAFGGYTLVIQHSTVNAAHYLLSLYVDPISAAALVAVAGAGIGWSTGQVHVFVLGYYTEPIAAFLLLALIGFTFGGIGYILAMRSK